MTTRRLSPTMVYALISYGNASRNVAHGSYVPSAKPVTNQALMDRGLIHETLRKYGTVLVPTSAGWRMLRDMAHAEALRIEGAVEAAVEVGYAVPVAKPAKVRKISHAQADTIRYYARTQLAPSAGYWQRPRRMATSSCASAHLISGILSAAECTDEEIQRYANRRATPAGLAALAAFDAELAHDPRSAPFYASRAQQGAWLMRHGWTPFEGEQSGWMIRQYIASDEQEAYDMEAARRPRMAIGARGEVGTYEPDREGSGRSRMWRRDINDTPYQFTVVNMPDGEIRLFVSRYNGYGDGSAMDRDSAMRFACAWTRVHAITIQAERGWFGERAPVLREQGPADPHWSCGKTAIPCPDGTHDKRKAANVLPVPVPASTDDGSRLVALGVQERDGLVWTYELVCLSGRRVELPYALYASSPGMTRALVARTLVATAAYTIVESAGAVQWHQR